MMHTINDTKIEDTLLLDSQTLHDIRNQLNTILGYAQILQDELAPSQEQHKFALSIERAALSIHSHTTQKNEQKAPLSDKTPQPKKSHSKVLIVDDNEDNRTVLSAVLKKFPLDISTASCASIAIQKAQEENPDIIFMDINLPDMSGIEATAHIRERGSQAAIFALSGDAQALETRVKNNPDFLSYILKPFDRKKIKSIITEQLQLPSSTQKETPLVTEAHKILIVDDTLENLTLFEKILSPYHYDIRTLQSGTEALEVALEFQPELILLDVVMPKMDGYEVLAELKKNRATRDIITIFLTANDSPQDIVRGLQEGGSDYISKPFHPKELIARVNTHLQKARVATHLKEMMEYSFHELYTPLSVITSAMQMQELEYEATEYTEMTLAACHTIGHIYDDLYYSLHYRENQAQKELFDLKELIVQRVSYFTLVAKSRMLEFALEIEGELPLNSIKKDIERVIDNLLSNALKYTKEYSKISISTHLYEEKLKLSICNPTLNAVDTKRIFQKYYRHEEDVFGLGLGLELVQSLCNKHQIDIQTTINNGVFCIELEFVYKKIH